MMERISALIVDDESKARRKVRMLLGADPEIEIIGECANGREAIAAIKTQSPRLVFLDVEMPQISGFDVIEGIDQAQMPLVIFVTAHNQYAVRAFEVHAVEYLLKPYNDSRFHEALRHAKHCLRTENGDEINARNLALLETIKSNYLERLLIKTKDSAFFIKVAEIEWIEAQDKYVLLHVGAKSHLLREAISKLEARLDPKQFLRINRPYLVNIDCIVKLEPWSHHEYRVVLRDGTRLIMSRSERKRLGKLRGWDL
jgi:two-component system LytT family response regulator